MSNVLIFTPKHELEYANNLNDFISLTRKLIPLNKEYDHSSNYWKKVGNFTNFGVSNQDRDPANVLHSSLLPFAKAYIVYGGATKSGINSKFYAIRAINAACLEQYDIVDVTKLTIGDFDRAVQVARNSLGAGAAYQAGAALKKLLNFLVDNKLVSRFVWKSPIKKPKDNPTGDEADVNRQKKMPDDNALMALANISSLKTENLSDHDIFTASIMTLLFSAPNRGSEPLYLKADCIHTETMKARRALDLGLPKGDILLLLEKQALKDGRDIPTSIGYDDTVQLIGLRWYSGKGYGHENKWLPTIMYDCATIALERLVAQSLPARNFARMLEESPYFPRHSLCPNVADDELLTKSEAALALGLDISVYEKGKKLDGAVNSFLRRRGVAQKDYVVKLEDLNSIVRNKLPVGFPYVSFKKGQGLVKVKWSNSLFAGFSNMFSTGKATIYTELVIPTIDTINEDLAPTKKTNKITGELLTGTLSVFQRWGHGNLAMTSHQLRHLLDTMAAVNGMEGEMRSKWAMRSDPKHNRYYNHTTPEEYGADFIEDREKELAQKEVTQTNQIQIQVATPRTIQELNTKAALTAHTTDLGMCITSYLNEPCTKYRDCINCNEHVCTKGDDDKCDRIRQRLAREEKLLKKDKEAVSDRVPGAEQWYQRRKQTTERFQQLLKMMEDPSIEDGSLIKLTDVDDVTQLDRAMEANGKKRLPEIINFKRIQSVSVDKLIDAKVNSGDEDIYDDLDDLDWITNGDT
jgi:hypothetical protein